MANLAATARSGLEDSIAPSIFSYSMSVMDGMGRNGAQGWHAFKAGKDTIGLEQDNLRRRYDATRIFRQKVANLETTLLGSSEGVAEASPVFRKLISKIVVHPGSKAWPNDGGSVWRSS